MSKNRIETHAADTAPAVARDALAPGRLAATARLFPGALLRKAAGGGAQAEAEEAVARAARSSGAPLPAAARERFERSLGADLSSVRVHTGEASAEAARAVGARAYTIGDDIHFADGQYAPADPFGIHLLAHEVAHTQQQAGGSEVRQHKLEISSPGDAAEVDADRAADAMVAGAPAQVGGAATTIAREEDAGGEKGGGGGSLSVSETSAELDGEWGRLSLDWKDGVKGSLMMKGGEKPIFSKAFQQALVSFYKVVGICVTGEIDVKAFPYGALNASGTFEKGKGGSITLGGSLGAMMEASGTVRVGPYLGVAGKVNVNSGYAAALKGEAKVSLTPSLTFQLGPDGKLGDASIELTLSAEMPIKATQELQIATYEDGKSQSWFSYELAPATDVGTAKGEAKIGAGGGQITTGVSGEFTSAFAPQQATLKKGVGAAAQAQVAEVKQEIDDRAQQAARNRLAPDVNPEDGIEDSDRLQSYKPNALETPPDATDYER